MASSKIKGITIEIGGNTTKLGKALEGVEKQSKSLQTELKGVNSLLKLDPKNVELLKQKQELLTQSIIETESKQKILQETLKKIDSGQVEVTKEQYRDLQREIVLTNQKLENLSDEMKNFGSVASQQLKAVGDDLKETGLIADGAAFLGRLMKLPLQFLYFWSKKIEKNLKNLFLYRRKWSKIEATFEAMEDVARFAAARIEEGECHGTDQSKPADENRDTGAFDHCGNLSAGAQRQNGSGSGEERGTGAPGGSPDPDQRRPARRHRAQRRPPVDRRCGP